MSTKEIGLEDSPKGKKKSDHVPNGEIKVKSEKVPKEDTSSVQSDNSDQETIEIENLKNMEQSSDKKPKGITKEIEEQILNGYKHVSVAYKKSLINFFKTADVDNVGYLTIQRFAPAVRKLGYTGTDRAIAVSICTTWFGG